MLKVTFKIVKIMRPAVMKSLEYLFCSPWDSVRYSAECISYTSNKIQFFESSLLECLPGEREVRYWKIYGPDYGLGRVGMCLGQQILKAWKKFETFEHFSNIFKLKFDIVKIMRPAVVKSLECWTRSPWDSVRYSSEYMS